MQQEYTPHQMYLNEATIRMAIRATARISFVLFLGAFLGNALYSLVGWVYAISGRRGDALKIASQFMELSSHAYVDFYQVAGIYAGLGDNDEALRLLEKGYQQHSPAMQYLAMDVFFDGIHSDPRYIDLLRRIGLPQPK